jgi:uncharacterized membrane protein
MPSAQAASPERAATAPAVKDLWSTTRAHTRLLEQIGGRSVGRLAALSDGIFAIVMTLLVLNLSVPVAGAIHSERELDRALLAIGPHLLVYAMSFLILSVLWMGQQVQLEALASSHRSLTWMHLAFLFGVTLMPFSASLLGELPEYRGALLVYWGNLALLGATLYLSCLCARHLHLTRDDMPADVLPALQRRILVLQVLYAFGIALSFFQTYWGIGFIIAVQLYYVGRAAAVPRRADAPAPPGQAPSRAA